MKIGEETEGRCKYEVNKRLRSRTGTLIYSPIQFSQVITYSAIASGIT